MRLPSLLIAWLLSFGATAAPTPVLTGFEAEAGHLPGTSDDAIRQGISIAIEAIHAAVGGRPLRRLVPTTGGP